MSTLDDEIAIRDLLAPLAEIEPVRRTPPRLRKRTTWIAAGGAVTAAILAVAAMAAAGTWIFRHDGGDVSGSQQISFHGKPYTLDVTASADARWFSLILLRGDRPEAIVHPEASVASASGGSILAAPGVKDLP